MVEQSNKTDSIFWAALEIASPDERDRYLQKACAGDPSLRAQLDDLLAAYPKVERFLEQPAIAADETAIHEPPIAEKSGTIIGPYKLLQQIGEGGMGVVFMAEQTKPVERKVALKIIKPGMDSRQVIARFEAERQALALMDHPNIARMLDAGTTESSNGTLGRPYFVMELVKGVPITHYCDEHRLNPRERLRLFISVCEAVQHAHQKGIIHRDIKPTNILVADYDDRPMAKVIDFGVAKAVGQQLTQSTMFTEFGQIIGTIEYMSPEQAKLNQLDIDTRTDIYSLGVLLYELLTGETPFDRQRLRSAAFDEMLRIIREEEPPKPSTRLSTSQSLPSIAANRHVEPKKLTTTIAGDLDWIVMKALEKDRSRRYEAVAALADDVERYLADQPVLAHRPTRSYRLKKFIRRNKFALAAACGIAAALIIGLVSSTFLFFKEREARVEAVAAEEKARRETEKLQQTTVQLGHNLWELGDALAASERRHDAERILTEGLHIFNQSAADFPDFVFFRQEQAYSEVKIGQLLNSTGHTDESENHLRTAIRQYAALKNEFSANPFYAQEEAHTTLLLGDVLQSAGRHEEAVGVYHEAGELLRKAAEKGDSTAQDRLGGMYLGGRGVARDYGEALKWLRSAAKQGNQSSQTALGAMHERGTGVSVDNNEAVKWYRLAANQGHGYAMLRLAGMYADGRGVVKDEREASKLYRQAAEHFHSAVLPSEAGSVNEVAWELATIENENLRDPETAVELAQKAVNAAPNDGNYWNTLGAAQYRAGNWQAAIKSLNESVELSHGGDAFDYFFMAMALQRIDKIDEARKWYDKAIESMKKSNSENEELIRFRAEAASLLGIAQAKSSLIHQQKTQDQADDAGHK